MSPEPTVTVVIPVYNGEQYVSHAIASILAQSFRDFELVLIDDASTDRSMEILRSYEDPRVRVVRNNDNLGLSRTHNRGLDLARGRYIAMLDHDDWSYPNRLAEQVSFLEQHDDHVLVGSWAEIMNAQGQTTRRKKRYPVSPDEIDAGLLFRCCVFHPSIMARTQIMREYRYSENLSFCDDFDLFVRLSRAFRLANLSSTLVRHRRHEDRTSVRRAHLKKSENLGVFRRQLTELGVSFTDLDLERHYLLGQIKTLGFHPDNVYLEWAQGWLGRLQAANQQASRYPEPAFSQAVRTLWLKACWHGSSRVGWSAWKSCLRSPLSKGACSTIGRHFLQACFAQKPHV